MPLGKPDNQRPSRDVQRAMIEQKRDQFRAAGFEAELELATLKVQEPASKEEKEQQEKAFEDLKLKAANCYRSATELSGMLATMPKPKAKEGSG